MPPATTGRVGGGEAEALIVTAARGRHSSLCNEIIADQHKSRQAMADAAQLLFNGQLVGQHFVKVDYVKAITLMQASGNSAEYNNLVHALRERAVGGNALAVARLKA